MTVLEKVKILIELRKIENKIAGISLNSSLALAKVESDLISAFNLSLDRTTPKLLFGKPYSRLSSEEVAIYSRIKRALKRSEV